MKKQRRLHTRHTLSKHLNILLKPKGWAPRACKVVDYSRGGMLLESQARENELPIPLDVDLSRGETAEISFSDPGQADQQTHTLSAQIVRVSESCVAVYFRNPKQEILDRLEDVVMRHVDKNSPPEDAAEPTEISDGTHRMVAVEAQTAADSSDLRRWVIPGALIGALILLSGIVFYISKLQGRVNALEEAVVQAVRSRGDVTVLRDLRNELGVLSARIGEVSDRVTEINQPTNVAEESSDTDVQRILETQQKQLDAVTNLVGKLQSRIDELARRGTTPSDAVAMPSAAPDAKTAGNGPWVVHLMSVEDPVALAKMKSKAEALGISAEEELVTVRGRQIRRLNVVGFASRSDAETFAKQAMDRLGLRDKPWVAKR